MADELFARAIEAMTDVQRRSAEAAGQLVERLVARVDGQREPSDASSGPPNAGDDAIAEMTKLWRESITSLASAMSGGNAGNARIDVQHPASQAPLAVTLDTASGAATTEVWVHNPGADTLDKLRLHCASAVASDGTTLEAAITLEPDSFGLPPRSSRGIVLTIDAPDAIPGVYRTLLLVDGLPEQWLPLEIAVPKPE